MGACALWSHANFIFLLFFFISFKLLSSFSVDSPSSYFSLFRVRIIFATWFSSITTYYSISFF